MRKFWIDDEEDTPQRLPLHKLLTRIWSIACRQGCEFFVRRSQGYGLTVNRWDALLDEADEIPVTYEELQRIAIGTEEWFYDVDVRCVTQGEVIALGLHDSTSLYLVAPDSIAQKVLTAFKDVSVDPDFRCPRSPS